MMNKKKYVRAIKGGMVFKLGELAQTKTLEARCGFSSN